MKLSNKGGLQASGNLATDDLITDTERWQAQHANVSHDNIQ